MKASTRRIIEMGTRVLNFSEAHPDSSPGYAAALSRLKENLALAQEVAERQRTGIIEVRNATRKKHDLRRTIRRTHLVHLATVARDAADEAPDMARKFSIPSGTNAAYLSFRTAARGILAEAQNQKELMVRHGLVDTVLESLTDALAQFDAAVQQGTEGRRSHVGASAELATIADDIIQVVRVMDGQNRYRFLNDPDALVEWESSSNTFGPPRQAAPKPAPQDPGSGGEVKPAA
jgi:hypothetical protein